MNISCLSRFLVRSSPLNVTNHMMRRNNSILSKTIVTDGHHTCCTAESMPLYHQKLWTAKYDQAIKINSQIRNMCQSKQFKPPAPPKQKVNLVLSLTFGIATLAVFGITIFYTYLVHVQREEYVSQLNEQKHKKAENPTG